MSPQHIHAATSTNVPTSCTSAASLSNKLARRQAKQAARQRFTASDKCPARLQRSRLLKRIAEQQSDIDSRSYFNVIRENTLRAAVMSDESDCYRKRRRIASMSDDLAYHQRRQCQLSNEIATAAGVVRCDCICAVAAAIFFPLMRCSQPDFHS